MKNIDKKVWLFAGSIIVVILLCISFLMIREKNNVALEGIISPEDASSMVVQYVETLTQGMASVSLIGVVEKSGTYEIELNIDGQEFKTYITKDGKFFFPEALSLEAQDIVASEGTIGDFTKTEEDICLDNGKPIIHYFGSPTGGCSSCQWQKPVITEAMTHFEGYAIFKDVTGTDDDSDIFARHSGGRIPLIVIGCNYFRVGAGMNRSEEEDIAIISALTCNVTGGYPQEICDSLSHLINQI